MVARPFAGLARTDQLWRHLERVPELVDIDISSLGDKEKEIYEKDMILRQIFSHPARPDFDL